MTLQSNYWILSLSLLVSFFLGNTATIAANVYTVNPKILHIINRLSFGPRPGDIQRVESIGIDSYIEKQLLPDSIPEPESLTRQIAQLQTVRMNPVQLSKYLDIYTPGTKPSESQKKLVGQRRRQIVEEQFEARLFRAINSPRQLQELMVDFWYNHFNVYANKGEDSIWVGAYEAEAIRPYALGRFRDLLTATAHHPAMLLYLDNAENRVTGHQDANGKISGLNENYARELMELHTLGVDGGYTQQDVVALARILSGWGIQRHDRSAKDGLGFEFHPKFHDFGDKVFMMKTIKGSGLSEGEEALSILARSPTTARHISYEIAQYFVSDNPPETLVKQMMLRYLSTDGDIREVLRTLFHSKEFWDEQNFHNKFKTPYQYIISLVRATGIEVKNSLPISALLQQLAMPLYGCLTPDGYKNTRDIWLNPDAMSSRLTLAMSIASGALPLAYPQPQTPQESKNLPHTPVNYEQLINTLKDFLSDKTQTIVITSPPQLRSALILGSPDFMYR
jgi:uncharacterized protein (DUF1800 family)